MKFLETLGAGKTLFSSGAVALLIRPLDYATAVGAMPPPHPLKSKLYIQGRVWKSWEGGGQTLFFSKSIVCRLFSGLFLY